jgi:hypothetical protein
MDEKRLRERIQKLDALASDRNPHAAERDAARRKAAELRAMLPTSRKPDRYYYDPPEVARRKQREEDERLAQAIRNRAARMRLSDHEKLIHRLEAVLPKLKPGDRLIATELCMIFHTDELTKRQWNVVRMYVEEGELRC